MVALLAYQQRYVQDTSRIVVMEKSRRVGFDFSEALRVVRERAMGHRTESYWYASSDESGALVFMEYVQGFARAYNAPIELLDDQTDYDAQGKAMKVMSAVIQCRGRRTSTITVMSSNPMRFRSKGGDVGISEMAHHKQPEQLWAAAYPVITWGGRLRVGSTHCGESSFFNQNLVMPGRRAADPERYGPLRPNDPQVSLHRVDVHDAIADGLVEKINESKGTSFTRESFLEDCRRGCISDEAFREEYECVPSDQQDAWLSYELLRPRVRAHCIGVVRSVDGLLNAVRDTDNEHFKSRPLYGGVDVGRTKDRFVIYLFAGHDLARTAGVLVWQNVGFDQMEAAIETVARHARTRRICIDSTGLGMQLAERMATKFRHKCEGVTFTAATKADLFTRLRRDVEEATVELPDDATVLADLNSLRVKTVAGNPRFDAERSAERGHADIATACALACAARDRAGSGTRSYELQGALC